MNIVKVNDRLKSYLAKKQNSQIQHGTQK